MRSGSGSELGNYKVVKRKWLIKQIAKQIEPFNSVVK